MKLKLVIGATTAIFAATATWATDFVWTGNTQHAEDWFDNDNWTVDGAVPAEGVYPGANDTATFNKDASLNVNGDITVGALVLNANLTHRRDKWLKVGAMEGNGKLILRNRGRLEFTNSAELDVSVPIDMSDNDGGQLLYIRTTGSGIVNLRGKLTGNGDVSLEGSLKLYGDNSGFEGRATIHQASTVEFRSANAGSAKATWVYSGNSKKTSHIDLDGDIYFGAFQQTSYGAVDFRVNLSKTDKVANLVIGNDNDVDSFAMGSWGDANNNNDRPNSYARITKVGSSTLKVYCPWHRLGTEIRGGVLEVIGPNALTGRNTASISPISFTGGTLKYGMDATTDPASPAAVTTDWSSLVSGSTEFISVDTDGHDITWSSESICNNNPDAKGFVKKGEGTLELSGSKRDGTWKFFSDATKTNIIEGGALEIRNAKYNSDFTLASTILGSGTLKICSEEHLGGIRLHGTEALADFTGTLDWANELAEREVDEDENVKGYASGLRMTDSINFEMPNAKFRVSGNPPEPTVVMLVETQWNPASAHVTVGAYEHLNPNAVIWTERSAWTLNILGVAGDSYLNGTFTNQPVYVVKTGAGKLTMGPGFAAPEGSTISVNEGVFAMDAGMTAANLPSYLTIANGVKLAGSGVFGAVDLSVNDVVAPALTAETDKTTEFTLLTATSITGTSATMTELLETVNAGDTHGKWKLVKKSNGDGTVTLKCVYGKNAFVIVIR